MQNIANPFSYQKQKADALLQIQNLKVQFKNDQGILYAVDDVSWDISSGEIIGLVGESGCGKSVSALTIAGLLDHEGMNIEGKILFQNKDLCQMSFKELSTFRGTQIGFVFQDPMSSLNPMQPIWKQISEAAVYHKIIPKSQAKQFAIDWMNKVDIHDAENRYLDYPHQLSGGMRQRVMIAIALSCNPKLLICDEPTTSLDVTVEKQIMDLLLKLRDDIGLSILLITHNLAMALNHCDRLMVMHGGLMMEQGTAYDILQNPAHEYTKHLFNTSLNVGRSEQILRSAENFRESCLFLPHNQTQNWTNRNQIHQVLREPDHFVNSFRNNTHGVA